jgi:Ca-activated chloride channel homolog
MKKICLSLLLICSMMSFIGIQQLQITGTVTAAVDGSPLAGVNVTLKGTKTSTATDVNGNYKIQVPGKGSVLVFTFIGMKTQEVKVGSQTTINIVMEEEIKELSEVVVTGIGAQRETKTLPYATQQVTSTKEKKVRGQRSIPDALQGKVAGLQVEENVVFFSQGQAVEEDNEDYAEITENAFHEAIKDPLSTFSIDVDKASYSNVRRFINLGQRPPKDAVRIEEMINYFTYDYPQPSDEHPFSVYTEISEAPWNSKHKLVHIGIQGKTIPTNNLPPSNLVFLIDVSGSMDHPNKLPLVKQSLTMLTDQLRDQDHVAIVVYAGAAGVVLEPTKGSEKNKIIDALENLQAGGSTAGGAGIKLAYSLALQHFKTNGNNRVIIATDGDFNVGASSNEAMEDLIEEKRKDGIFLTVLGYGMGNYKDSKMEILADKGNGNYAYIDNITEARKTLVNEFGGTLFTIAKDVKLQLEFNPAKVQAYRLVGYENRMLKSEDFNNDKKDAGELGSGHTVTALYEIIPVGVKSDVYNVDGLKYQKSSVKVDASSDELLTVKLRYKKPDGDVSKLIIHPLKDSNKKFDGSTENFKWSSAVAGFGMLLRDSEYIVDLSYERVAEIAQSARGKDTEGYRAEFVNMVKSFSLVSKR